MKKYFIYWKTDDLGGNIVLSIDWKNTTLKEVIKEMISILNNEKGGEGITNLTIPFMIEVK